MSRELSLLVPAFRSKVNELLAACLSNGVTMVPYQTLRDPWTQARYWRQSRSFPEIRAKMEELRSKGAPFLADVIESVGPQDGRPITNAIPGLSWHQWGEAVDCFWEVAGGAEWSATRRINGVNGYQIYAGEAVALGLDVGGHWSSLKDWPHVQLQKGKSPLAYHSLPEIDTIMRDRFGGSNPALSASSALVTDDDMRLAYQSAYGWKVFGTRSPAAFLWKARMTICADGAPKCYHPKGCPPALDYTANGGRPGNWWGIATDTGKPSGKPLVQEAGEPAPGFFVSMTALGDPTVPYGKQKRYVDADSIPYVVLPGGGQVSQFTGSVPLRLGDFAMVFNTRNQTLAAAFCAEIGPKNQLGEGSIELARRLGIPEFPTNGGIQSKDIVYLTFPGSGNQRPRADADIQSKSTELFDAWGGMDRLLRAISGISA